MKVLLIEDELAAAQRLEQLLKTLRPEVEIIAQPDTVAASVDWLKAHPHPDLVLMDIQLADGLCFNIFEQVRVAAPIIFTTAYDQFALQAFKVNSVDYLLKPVKKEELKHAIEKLEQWHAPVATPDYEELAKAIQNRQAPHKKRFLIRVGQAIKTVNTADIAYFYSESKNTFLCTQENRTYTIDDSLDRLEEILPQSLFYRVNRKFIVNLQAIETMHTYSKARVLLELDPPYKEKVIVSTDRSPHFKKWLADDQ